MSAQALQDDDRVFDVPLSDALSERYLAYALSTIVSRSLPDVRDGLKPVHRRLLFAMRELKLSPRNMPKKSARVVGDVIGKYHPHGDTAVYDTLVRLAQDFAERYPLIEGQGNFGNIDGDNAAAMRYTEAKLTQVSDALLDGLDENAVDFRATYDGEGAEPVVLPSAFPNLLANGSTGIAVGMATSIPPHNVGEICKALKHLIKTPNASVSTLVNYIQGPDFPTGGELVEDRAAIVQAYETGRGSFRMRAKWEVEKLSQGTWQIVVTEIPFQIQKSKLIERIADIIGDKKVPFLDDVRDESAEDIRVVLTPKSRNIQPEILMEAMFKHCDLETRFSMNMNVLDKGKVPKVMPLNEVLQAFLDHRHEVLLRRKNYRLDQINHRLEILDGFLIAYLNLDRVIQIIRFEDHPKNALISEFRLTEVQADAILNMRLRALHKLQELEIKKEHEGLSAEKSEIEALLADTGLQWSFIKQEITEIEANFGLKTQLGARRTIIGDAPDVIDLPDEAFIEKEAITIVCSEKGWVRAFKGHAVNVDDIKYKEGDSGRFIFTAETTDKLLLFTTMGKFYTINADKLPRGRGFGEPLSILFDLAADETPLSLFKCEKDKEVMVVSNISKGFRARQEDLLAQTKNGRQVLNVSDKERALLCVPVQGDHIAIIGNNRKMLVFPIDEIPLMNRGKGVQLQRFKDGRVNDVKLFNMEEGLKWEVGSRTRHVEDMKPWLGRRAGSGKLPPNGFPKTNKF